MNGCRKGKYIITIEPQSEDLAWSKRNKSSLWLSAYVVGPPNESSRKRSDMEARIEGRVCRWKEKLA